MARGKTPPARDGIDTAEAISRRDFFHMQQREERRWHEMLRDAPSDYSIHWIDELMDPKLRAYLRQAYIQLRQEQDQGKGVSILRDMLLRRLLWCARIAVRLEGAMEEYEFRDMIAASRNTQWQAKILKSERYYLRLTQVMVDICYHLNRTGPKRKKPQDASLGRVATGTVQIPVDDTE